MATQKLLPAHIGTYRIIKRSELTPYQLATLRAAGAERVRDRICVLIGDGKVAVSEVQACYAALMREVGNA